MLSTIRPRIDMGMNIWAVRQAPLVWSEWIIVMVEIVKMRASIKAVRPLAS